MAFANTVGNEPNQSAHRPTSFRYLQTIVYSRPLKRISERLTYVAQSDFGYQNDAIAPAARTPRWYGLNQYLFYKVSDCMTYGVRAEWFRDEEGYRVGGFLGTTPAGADRGLSTDSFRLPRQLLRNHDGCQLEVQREHHGSPVRPVRLVQR